MQVINFGSINSAVWKTFEMNWLRFHYLSPFLCPRQLVIVSAAAVLDLPPNALIGCDTDQHPPSCDPGFVCVFRASEQQTSKIIISKNCISLR